MKSLGLGQDGQQQRREDGDDGDNYQQFDQSERRGGVAAVRAFETLHRARWCVHVRTSTTLRKDVQHDIDLACSPGGTGEGRRDASPTLGVAT